MAGEEGDAVVAKAVGLLGAAGAGDDFEQAVVFAGELRQEEACQCAGWGDGGPVLFASNLAFLSKAFDVGDEDFLGAFAADPVTAVFVAGGSAKDGFREGQLEVAAGAAHQNGGFLAGAHFASILHVAVAHGGET